MFILKIFMPCPAGDESPQGGRSKLQAQGYRAKIYPTTQSTQAYLLIKLISNLLARLS